MSSFNPSIECGIPPHDFFGPAWESEPLTGVLKETNILRALPFPDAEVSYVAKDGEGGVIGQCSANAVTKYWEHLEQLETTGENLSTQIFVKIHQKAVAVERDHLRALGKSEGDSLHNAGVAVLPEHRGKRIGIILERAQIDLCRALGKTTLFCETTNRHSAQIMEKSGFEVVAKFPYAQLAEELGHPELKGLNGDAFTVWCLKI